MRWDLDRLACASAPNRLGDAFRKARADNYRSNASPVKSLQLVRISKLGIDGLPL
jgi:hypothetical protein